jgi:hypothetical protein
MHEFPPIHDLIIFAGGLSAGAVIAAAVIVRWPMWFWLRPNLHSERTYVVGRNPSVHPRLNRS